MNNKTLKLTSNFGTKYEFAKSKLKDNLFFQESEWLAASKSPNVNLDMYISALSNSDKIKDVNKFYTDYGYEHSNAETRVASLYNEVFKDDLSKNIITREREVKDDKGNVIYKDGEPVTEKYETSEYEYFKSLLKQKSDNDYNNWLRQQEEERKSSMNGFNKWLGTHIASPLLSAASGVSSVADGLISAVAGIGAGVSAQMSNGNFADAFTETISDETWRPFDDFQQWVTDFESRYTDIRDVDGNYTNLGKYLGGASYTIGQMVPSILINYYTGGVAGSVMSQLVYYGALTSNNIKETYDYFASQGVTVTTAAILSNATIKSGVEFAIEKLLGKILGGSYLDNLVFGRTSGKVVGKSSSNLVVEGLKRYAKDAGQESLEEVLQEISGFLVDQAYVNLVDENFGELTDLTWQSLVDAAVIAFIVSTGTTSVQVLRTDASLIGKKGITGKIAAWEYGLNVQSLVESYNKIEKYKKSNDLDNVGYDLNGNINNDGKRAYAALTEMYSSYRILSSLYGEIGEARFNSANNILTKITENVRAGKYDTEVMYKAANDVYESVFGKNNLNKEQAEEILNKTKEARITELEQKLTKGELIEDSELSEEISDLIENSNIKELLIAKDGNNVVRNEEAIIVPKNLLKNAGSKVVLRCDSENDLVDKIVKNAYFKTPLNEVHQAYKELTGRYDVTLNESVRALLFDTDATLYKSLLVTANKDMYKLISNLTFILSKVKDLNTLRIICYTARKISKTNITCCKF